MKNKLYISASIDQPVLLKEMVEKLAMKRAAGFQNTPLIGEWQTMDTSAIEKYVSGTVDLQLGNNSKIKMPFVTCFLFSCIADKEAYHMNWCMSCS